MLSEASVPGSRGFFRLRLQNDIDRALVIVLVVIVRVFVHLVDGDLIGIAGGVWLVLSLRLSALEVFVFLFLIQVVPQQRVANVATEGVARGRERRTIA